MNQPQATSTLNLAADPIFPAVPISFPPSPLQPPQLLAQQSRVRRLQFAPGKYSTTLEDAVVRGTRDIYLVGAKQGQTIWPHTSFNEQNATYDHTAC